MAINTDFSGRTALITGAARGIGAACAHWLDTAGAARIILIDLDEDALNALDLSCEVHRHCGDVSDPSFWDALEPRLGRIDHAVVNAGIADGGMIAQTTFDDWRRIMAVNLDGAFLTLRAAMRAMADGGSVVVTSSVSGLKPMAGAGAYGASKAALIHLAKTAALEGAPTGIRVNTIAPGGVDTGIWDGNPQFDQAVAEHGREKAIKMMASGTPSGRFATPAEIAQTMGFLLSDQADNITGAVLSSDGGFSI